MQSDILKRIKCIVEDDYILLDNRFVRQYAIPGLYDTYINVSNISSLGAAQTLRTIHPNDKICVLNFASAKNPGGGFLNAAQAQEESLARSSTLYASLSQAHCFYNTNTAANSSVYTHNIVYSDNITVFRDDSGDEILLEYPYTVDFITCAAVNRRITQRMSSENVMIERTRRLFAVTKKHNVEHLVLGAWGCGVSKNHPIFVINMFLQQLRGDFKGIFKSVTFAVLGDNMYNYFREALLS